MGAAVDSPESPRATEAVAREREGRENVKADRDHAKRDQQREAILTAYRLFPDGETGRTIREAAGLSGARFAALNAELLTEGIVEPCGVKKHTREEAGFRLVNPFLETPHVWTTDDPGSCHPPTNQNIQPECDADSQTVNGNHAAAGH